MDSIPNANCMQGTEVTTNNNSSVAVPIAENRLKTKEG